MMLVRRKQHAVEKKSLINCVSILMVRSSFLICSFFTIQLYERCLLLFCKSKTSSSKRVISGRRTNKEFLFSIT